MRRILFFIFLGFSLKAEAITIAELKALMKRGCSAMLSAASLAKKAEELPVTTKAETIPPAPPVDSEGFTKGQGWWQLELDSSQQHFMTDSLKAPPRVGDSVELRFAHREQDRSTALLRGTVVGIFPSEIHVKEADGSVAIINDKEYQLQRGQIDTSKNMRSRFDNTPIRTLNDFEAVDSNHFYFFGYLPEQLGAPKYEKTRMSKAEIRLGRDAMGKVTQIILSPEGDTAKTIDVYTDVSQTKPSEDYLKLMFYVQGTVFLSNDSLYNSIRTP